MWWMERACLLARHSDRPHETDYRMPVSAGPWMLQTKANSPFQNVFEGSSGVRFPILLLAVDASGTLRRVWMWSMPGPTLDDRTVQVAVFLPMAWPVRRRIQCGRMAADRAIYLAWSGRVGASVSICACRTEFS